MRLLKRWLQRLLVLALEILSVWLIDFVFRFTDRRLPWVLALALTYGIAAYIILPRTVRMGLKFFQRKRVPRYTTTGDGLPGDPVNLVLTGTLATASSRVFDRRLVRGRSAQFGKLVGNGPSIRFQLSVSNSPI